MSYILEALRKAERERRLSEAPSVPEILSNQPEQRLNWLPWLAAFLLLAINCALLWHFWVNGKNDTNQPGPLPASGNSAKPDQRLSPKAENQATEINAIKNPAPPSVNPAGQTGNVVESSAKAPSPQGNAVELSRHSGMDRRNPDCMDASKTRHPWSLSSGDHCRNDGEVLNSTALPLEPRQPMASKPERTIASPTMGETNGKPLERGLQEDEIQIIKENLKPLIPAKDRLDSVKMMARQKDDSQEQGLDTPVPTLNEMPKEKKDNAHIKINVLAYSNNPEERFAVINMVKYTKGERLPGGEILQDIQANGVVLELDGRRFRVENH